jgi:hypothetical protein
MNTPSSIVARLGLVAAVLSLSAGSVAAQVSPPDLSVCDGVDACEAPESVCDAGGFTVTLTSYVPAPSDPGGSATYVYTVCAPANDGTCSDSGAACLDHSDCRHNQCQKGGPHEGTCSQDDTTPCTGDEECNTATCSGDCRVEKFKDLSHADVVFPELGGVESCLGETTEVTVACHSPARGDYAGTLGDGSCFSSSSPVAKCDSPNLGAGECVTLTLTIAGELNEPGLGAAVVVDKPGNVCESSCIAGPSCDPCVAPPPPPGEQCLTRTIGFWGTHPWVTNDFTPVTVCGKTLGCSGASNGVSNPTCLAGSCTSVIEGLCSIPSEDSNQAYVAMVRQLTAAKLNLNATAALLDGDTCGGFTYGGETIQQWIATCEALCGASKATISASGCIEALDAFNNSPDAIDDVTPSPFDRPSIDDFGNVSGADPEQCTIAHGTGGNKKLVIGKKVGSSNCQ